MRTFDLQIAAVAVATVKPVVDYRAGKAAAS
jgi:hypothetical protein